MPRPARTLPYRNRATGETLLETVFGDGALDFLYANRLGRLLTNHLLTTRAANRLYGLRQRSSASRAKIAPFIASMGIDAGEAEKPVDEYTSLDDFFTRRLKPSARPIDREASHLVSPADGRALAFARLDADARLVVKGSDTSLSDLVRDDALVRDLGQPCALVVRLAPADYHRVHFPDGGAASPARSIDGRLHSVHPIALDAGAPSFANHRVVTRLDSVTFGPLGIVDVGALLVGTIVETYRAGDVVRGDEKSYFRFGGSTVVVLARSDRVTWDDDLVRATREGVESQVRMGTRIARARS